MALTNAQAAQQWAALNAALQAGTLSQADYATQLQVLLDTYNLSNVSLAQQVALLAAEFVSALAGLQAFGIKGVVATVSALPTNAAPGDGYLVVANGHGYAFISGAWVDVGQFQGPPGSTRVSMAFSSSTLNIPGEKYPPYPCDGSITLSAANSLGYADVAASADALFTLTRNGGSIGTALFKAGTTRPVITLTATALSAGDIVRLVAPANPDATLSGASVTLSGNRTS